MYLPFLNEMTYLFLSVKRYPCQLYELARPVPPEELLSEEEEIPLID